MNESNGCEAQTFLFGKGVGVQISLEDDPDSPPNQLL